MPRAWIHPFDFEDDATLKGIVQALGASGVETFSLDFKELGTAGVVLFKEVTQGLCEFLRSLANGGIVRILAVPASPGSLSNADTWRLLNAGACDVLGWDASADTSEVISAKLARINLVEQLVNSPHVAEQCVGRSAAIRTTLHRLVEVAHFTDSPVLLVGESGTGKEVAARLIHALDRRPDKRALVVVDCTTIVPELSGSEFFGHERGAFTGAVAPREGAFALADGGTLFLDEIGELPLGLQGQLLRVVQERAFKKVGGNLWQKTSFRLICATNRNLEEEVALGKFRSDLFYRISAWTCRMPPLRERIEDIIPLATHFMSQGAPEGKAPEMENTVSEYLHLRAYPGNVRDLKQLVSRIMHRHVGPGRITAGDIPQDDRLEIETPSGNWCDAIFHSCIRRALASGIGLKEIGRTAENVAFQVALDQESGNLHRTASRLGVTDRALQLRKASFLQTKNTQDVSEAS